MATTKRKPQVAVLATREQYAARMRAAADAILNDRPQAERYAWADAKVQEYLRRGVLALSGEVAE